MSSSLKKPLLCALEKITMTVYRGPNGSIVQMADAKPASDGWVIVAMVEYNAPKNCVFVGSFEVGFEMYIVPRGQFSPDMNLLKKPIVFYETNFSVTWLKPDRLQTGLDLQTSSIAIRHNIPLTIEHFVTVAHHSHFPTNKIHLFCAKKDYEALLESCIAANTTIQSHTLQEKILVTTAEPADTVVEPATTCETLSADRLVQKFLQLVYGRVGKLAGAIKDGLVIDKHDETQFSLATKATIMISPLLTSGVHWERAKQIWTQYHNIDPNLLQFVFAAPTSGKLKDIELHWSALVSNTLTVKNATSSVIESVLLDLAHLYFKLEKSEW